MMNSKVITISTFLLVLICVILSVTAAPMSYPNIVARNGKGIKGGKNDPNSNENVNNLLSDSFAVTSLGKGGNNIDLQPYDDNDVVPGNVAKDGNKALGDGKGFKI
ncbi:hypothetical protein C1645_761275 [Glomus cerebriforme]|uniref:Uncharacterized protein n=1 Tax=Glomus cerebriforme TaxID=658196 RepID=A0A397T9A5_9GLOM|nr:hypothetical protein C1645_761275 [Glomus cerebriforme]